MKHFPLEFLLLGKKKIKKMCGTNVFNWKDENLIKIMNKTLKHQGPDGQEDFMTRK